MTSNAKRRENKRNSTNGGGPKTEAGRRRVRLNALKEGLFAHELIVKENEKPEYAALQTGLRKQYAPSTPMQQIGFERIFCCALSDHPKPANEYHLKTGQRKRRPGH